MTTADLLLIAALVAFLLAWWIRRIPSRGKVLLLFAALTLAAGLWGVYDDRWQAGVGLIDGLVFLIAIAISTYGGAGGRWMHYVPGTLFTLLGLLAIAALYLFPVRDLPTPSGDHAGRRLEEAYGVAVRL